MYCVGKILWYSCSLFVKMTFCIFYRLRIAYFGAQEEKVEKNEDGMTLYACIQWNSEILTNKIEGKVGGKVVFLREKVVFSPLKGRYWLGAYVLFLENIRLFVRKHTLFRLKTYVLLPGFLLFVFRMCASGGI